MSGSRPGEPVAAPRDWFLAAIEAKGSVADSLDAVLAELGQRMAFVKAVRAAIAGQGGVDAVTDLSQKIKGLENTLRLRLGMLRPERPAAWFRAPAATSSGPFSVAVIGEPVFAPYDAAEVERVQQRLAEAWRERQVERLPFKDDSVCLWRTLLGYAAALERLQALPEPFAGLRLDQLPDELPPGLESRALRAFLLNVRTELLSLAQRLEACHGQLLATSEKLWAHQHEEVRAQAQKASTRARPSPAAEQVREELRRRRARGGRATFLAPAELEAMRFMGFDDLPSAVTLRQRYLTMAKRLHPDLHGGSDTGFKMLTSAYERLLARVGA